MKQKRFVVTQNSWIPRIVELIDAAKLVGVDIETYSAPQYSREPTLYGLDPWRNKIRSVQLATREYSWLIDLHHVTDIEPLRRMLLDRNVTKVVHNSLFETTNFLRHWDGAFPDNVFDTLLASRLYHSAHSNMRHSLAEVVRRYLKINLAKEEQLSDWSRAELSESQIEYAFTDAEILIPLYDALYSRLQSDGMLKAAEIEFDAVLGFADMQLYGIRVDMEKIEQITTAIGDRIGKLRRYLGGCFPSPILSLFEEEFGPSSINLDSPSQLLEALAEKGIHPVEENRITGEKKPSTKKGALLAVRNKRNARLIDALLDYSSLQQMMTTYCEPMRSYIHPVTGKIHAAFRQLGQAQHRPAVTKPNLLNIPRPNKFGPGVENPAMVENFKFDLSFRDAFIPDDGMLFSIADFSNNQARIVADRAQVEAMKRAFIEGLDPYKTIAAAVLRIPYENVTGSQRQDAKVWVLAFLFGAGWRRYQQAVLELARLTISDTRAMRDRQAFFQGLPELEVWHENEPAFVVENGYVLTPQGRRVYFDMTRVDEQGRLKIPRNDAINYPICASEVDGAKLALGKIARLVRIEGLDPAVCGIKGYIYDEIVVEVPKFQAEEFCLKQKAVMTECMQSVLATVPAVVSGGVGANWGAKS